jgi:hypothetical protein
MATFHPRTLELLREDLGQETVTHSLDTARLAKLPKDSQSLMAKLLRGRIAAFPDVKRDLERLLDFAEGVNRLHDEHERGSHNGRPHRVCADCDELHPVADLGARYDDGHELPGEPEGGEIR